MAGNSKRRRPLPVNKGVHKVPLVNEKEWTKWNEKPFYGHKRDRDLVINQGDMVLATFTEWTKSGYKIHNHPAFVVSTNRSLSDTKKVWLVPMYREASVGFNGEANVKVSISECSGLKTDGNLAVGLFQCLPVSKVIKKIGHVTTNRVFDELAEKLLSQIGISMVGD